MIKLFIIITVLFTPFIYAEDKNDAKRFISASVEIGYCQQFNILYRNNPYQKLNNYKPFIDFIVKERYSRYYSCHFSLNTFKDSVFLNWYNQNPETYSISYMKGMCDLKSDINEIYSLNEKTKEFFDNSNLYFEDRFNQFHLTYPEWSLKYGTENILDFCK